MGREVQAGRAERVAPEAGDRDRPHPPHPARHLPELRHRQRTVQRRRQPDSSSGTPSPPTYNEISWNPVLYLEWYPRKSRRTAPRSGSSWAGTWARRGLWAANVYAEGNVDYFNASYAEGFDGEFGATASVSWPVDRATWLRLGAEVQGGVDQHGSRRRSTPRPSSGPNVLLTYRPAGLKLTATALFGVFPEDPLVPAVRHRRLAVLGWVPVPESRSRGEAAPAARAPRPQGGRGGRGLRGVVPRERRPGLDATTPGTDVPPPDPRGPPRRR